MIAALLMAFQLASDAPLPDAAQEARAQNLMREIRCVVCENEPVSQSTADIAVDMRRVIRTKVEEGASDPEIREFFSDRYGQFVLFRPPTQGFGILLWVFPFALLAAVAGFMGWRAFRSRPRNLAPLADEGRRDPDA